LRNFSVGQARGDFVTRFRTSDNDVNGTDAVLTVTDLFRPEEPQHIAITYDFSQQNVYVNGDVRSRTALPWGRFSGWDPSYYLVVGNEVTGNRPWLGKLFLLAIYNRALSHDEIRKNFGAGRRFEPGAAGVAQRVEAGLLAFYPFADGSGNRSLERSGRFPGGDLLIPARVKIGDQEFLSSPYAEFRAGLLTFRRSIDIIGNIIVFIPLGALLRAVLAERVGCVRKRAAWALVAGLLCTIIIESLQYFSQTRYSSMTDVIANGIGTGLGIMIDIRRRLATLSAH
jgi:VanZ family protein